VGAEVRGNYCTWNPLDTSGTTLSNGNLDAVSTGAGGISKGTFAVSSGKWYWEVTKNANNTSIGIALATVAPTTSYVGNGQTWSYYSVNGQIYTNGSGTSYGASYANGDVIGIALDLDNDTLTFYKNGVSQGTAVTGLTGTYVPAVGNDQNGPSVSANFGQRSWAYQAPSGFKALNTANLPAPLVTKPSEYMDAVTYTGTGSARSITGLEFSPDLVWIKKRSGTSDHNLQDVIRGVTHPLYSNLTNAQGTFTQAITAFNSDGFSLGTGGDVNGSSATYVAWCFDAGSSTVTNTQGSITGTVSVRASATAGFSVVTYTGDNTNTTVGHGLGAAPSLIICKSRNAADDWNVYHASVGNDKVIQLNSTGAAFTNSTWNDTTPTSTVFSIGTGTGTNVSGRTYVAYCFAPVAGYSSFGSYTGNGSADGPFVFLNFRARWIMFKRVAAADPWIMYDTARSQYNQLAVDLAANDSRAEAATSAVLDITSNGFKLRNSGTIFNQSGSQYIYCAFAESPFQYARAR
jgi:hypothetical protein